MKITLTFLNPLFDSGNLAGSPVLTRVHNNIEQNLCLCCCHIIKKCMKCLMKIIRKSYKIVRAITPSTRTRANVMLCDVHRTNFSLPHCVSSRYEITITNSTVNAVRKMPAFNHILKHPEIQKAKGNNTKNE